MLYILHGEDEFTRSEQLAQWKALLGDPAVASLNTTVLDGRKVTLPNLVEACDALPFMSERRLVAVEGFWSRLEPPDGGKTKGSRRAISASDTVFVKGLMEYLPRLPDTTRLVFVESCALSKGNAAFKLASGDANAVHVKEFPQLTGRDLSRWIEDRMKVKGGVIEPRAAQQLAELVGGDQRQLDQELDKLLAYANFERPVNADDVHNAVSAKHLVDVFDLVDAIGLRRGEAALRHLHQLLDAGAAPMYLLFMIVRQFRILLQVKELLSQRATVAEMQRQLGIRHAFIVEKASRQARNYSMERLESIYLQFSRVEQQIKTGEIEELLALDLLVAELAGGQ